MKKTILAAFAAATLLTSCGGGASLLQAMAANNNGTQQQTATTATSGGGLLSNIISTFAGGILTNQSTIVGTWTYQRPCVQFESENLLAKAGGSVAATKVESQLETYYQKVGIKPGTFTFTFDKDNTCKWAIGSRTSQGTYTFDSSAKTITIKTQTGMNIKAYVSVTGSSMGLTFDASKLLTLVSAASTVSSQLSTISTLASSFSGMKLGFELTK